MAIEIPDWFNADFLSNCLQNESKNKNIVVTDFKAESAVPPGNNYGSVVVRVYLNCRDESSKFSKRLVAKLPLTGGVFKEIVDTIQDPEPVFYSEYLPKANNLLKSFSFAPKYYPSSAPIVVLEDLKEAGFVMVDRTESLDFDNCILYAKSAAALHAGSVAVYKQDPELIKKICSERMFSDELKVASTTKNIMRYGLDCMANHVLKTLGNKRISSIIRKCSTQLWNLCVEAVKPGSFNTLNQGDPWITNMMFRYNAEGKCVQIKQVDFQVMRYASPASDLTFFIWTSLKHYIREEKLEEFIRTYVEAFNCYLEEVKCAERISLDLIKEDLLKMSPIALYIVATCLPVIQKSFGPDFHEIYITSAEEYSPEKNPYEVFFTEDFCKNHMTRLVNQMDKQNVFDYLERSLNTVTL